MSSATQAEADSMTSSNVLQPPFGTPENAPRITSRKREGSSNRGGARAVRIRPTPRRKIQPVKKQLRFSEVIDEEDALNLYSIPPKVKSDSKKINHNF